MHAEQPADVLRIGEQLLCRAGVDDAATGSDLMRAWSRAPQERAWLAGVGAATLALAVAGLTNTVGLAGAAIFAVLSALPGAAGPDLRARPLEPSHRPSALNPTHS